MSAANFAYLLNVFHGNRLAAAGVVCHRQHDQWNALRSYARDELFQRGYIHVSFERMFQAGLFSLCDGKVHGFSADEFDIGPGGIEVSIVGDNISFLAGDVEQNSLCRSPLMSGDHVAITEDFLD